ncbi:DUF2285 domain-containing protein [Maricaulis sp.]|uniref:DNA -binding domain-containing protein n=1 Tax=Maricaulis sp. TaxID=1486257 RepID=UPI0032979EAF
MATRNDLSVDDKPPDGDAITAYDRDHLALYIRLLDAEQAGAPLEEISPILLGIDAKIEPDRARHVHRRHLNRARWMVQHGYRDLLKTGFPEDAVPT